MGYRESGLTNTARRWMHRTVLSVHVFGLNKSSIRLEPIRMLHDEIEATEHEPFDIRTSYRKHSSFFYDDDVYEYTLNNARSWTFFYLFFF